MASSLLAEHSWPYEWDEQEFNNLITSNPKCKYENQPTIQTPFRIKYCGISLALINKCSPWV